MNDKLILRPVARLVKILGEHLIRDNTVGVMELIKNGYDADAENVTIELKNLSDPLETEIIIQDDGHGMDEKTIKGPWSEPAHGGKQYQKDKLISSHRGRLPLGEKGVGRFAAQKLGKQLELVTRPEGGKLEYCIKIDWDIFDNADCYLDQIVFPLEQRIPQIFTGNMQGTRLVIKGARTPWKKLDVEKLQTSLIRLLSPTDSIQNFSVNFKCPDYPELENLDRGDILSKFQFKIDCSIDERGFAKYVYSHRKDDREENIPVKDLNLWSTVYEDWEKFYPDCGPFRIIICAWLRRAIDLEKYGITKSQLNHLAGMSIYRDGFRVLPYGDVSDDWLGLDLRRTNQPGQKYGNNQIIGQVEITQEKNSNLIDKTNREGLQENQAYLDMRKLVLGVLSLLETESLEERSTATRTTETTKSLKVKVERLAREIEDLKVGSRQNTKSDLEPVKDENLETVAQDEKKSSTVEVPVEKLDDLEKQTSEIGSSLNKAVKELLELGEEKSEAFLHLMGIGLAAERFTHEFDRMVGALSGNLRALEEKHPHDSRIKALRLIFESLKNEVLLMSIARYVRKNEVDQVVSVREAITLSLAGHEKYIQDNMIQVEFPEGEDFHANISMASLSQVLDNVIANAVYWLNAKSEINDRRLAIVVNAKSKTITISDNGSKIAPNIKRSLFLAPFVTSKPDGRGLGLFISQKILKRNEAFIQFLSEDDPENNYQRASFKITFEQ